jgi:uncharacterized protein
MHCNTASKLILGTVQLGLDYGVNNQSGKPSLEVALKILDQAHDAGITRLDTAEAYGNAQEIIGTFHATRKKRFRVITKFSSKTLSEESFEEHVEQSIRILNIDKLEAYMFHSHSDYEQFPNELAVLRLLKKQNRLEKIGVSVYTNEEALQLMEKDNGIDLIQLPFNLLDNLYQRKKVLDKAQKKGVEIHVRSVFLQGLLMKKRSSIDPPLDKLIPYLKLLDSLAVDSRKPIEAMAINYPLQIDLIQGVLFGVDSLEQLTRNISFASDYHLSFEELVRINNIKVLEVELLNPVNWKAVGTK